MYFLQMHAATRTENNPPGGLMPRLDQGMAVVIVSCVSPPSTVSSNSHPGSAPGPPGRLGMVAEEEAWHRPR